MMSTSTGALLATGTTLDDPGAGTRGNVFSYGTTLQAAEAYNGAASYGNYLIAVNPANAATLFIYVIGRSNVFDPSVVELKVRAEGVPDPAGNTIAGVDADNNQITTGLASS